MSVCSDLSKAESLKVSPAMAGFLNTQSCATGAEVMWKRWQVEALLLGTATVFVAEPETWLIMQSHRHPLQPCSSSLAKFFTASFFSWSLVFLLKISGLSWTLDCLEQSLAAFCSSFPGWGRNENIVDCSGFGLKIGLAAMSNFAL